MEVVFINECKSCEISQCNGFIFNVVIFIIREFWKKKVEGGIAFALISFFHVKTQEPASRSTTTITFVFLAKFFYHKIFETRNQ